MKTLISYKTGYKPIASELKIAQLAINIADQAIYTKDDFNKVVAIGGTGDFLTDLENLGPYYQVLFEGPVVACDIDGNPIVSDLEFTIDAVTYSHERTKLEVVPDNMEVNILNGTLGGQTTLTEGMVIPDTAYIGGIKTFGDVTRITLVDILTLQVLAFSTVTYLLEPTDGVDGVNGADGTDGYNGARGSLAFSIDLQHSTYNKDTVGTPTTLITKWRYTGETVWLSASVGNDTWEEFVSFMLPDTSSLNPFKQIFGDEFRFQLYDSVDVDEKPITQLSTLCEETYVSFQQSLWNWNVVFWVNGNMIVDGSLSVTSLNVSPTHSGYALTVDANGDIISNGSISFFGDAISGTENVALMSGSGVNIANAAYSDFEQGSKPTFNESGNADTYYATWGNVIGKNSLRIAAIGVDAYVYMSKDGSCNIPIPDGRRWLISCYLRLNPEGTPKTTSNAQLYLHSQDRSGVSHWKGGTFSLPADSIQRRYSFIADLRSGTAGGADKICRLRIDNDSYNSAGTTYLFCDGLMMEEYVGDGSIVDPSPYVPPTLYGDSIAELVNNNVTTISGGKITTNTLNADRIISRTITAGKIAANSLTAYEIAANSITTSELSANSVLVGNIPVQELVTGSRYWSATADTGVTIRSSSIYVPAYSRLVIQGQAKMYGTASDSTTVSYDVDIVDASSDGLLYSTLNAVASASGTISLAACGIFASYYSYSNRWVKVRSLTQSNSSAWSASSNIHNLIFTYTIYRR